MSDSHMYYQHYKMKLKVSCIITHTHHDKRQCYYSSHNKSSKSACLWIQVSPPYTYSKKYSRIQLVAIVMSFWKLYSEGCLIHLSTDNTSDCHILTLCIHHSPHSVNNMIQMNSLVGIREKLFHHVFKNEVRFLGFNLLFFFFFYLGMLQMTKRTKQVFKTFM